MKIRLATKKLIISGVIGATVMLIVAAVTGYLWFQKTQEKELALKEKYKQEIAELSYIAEQSNMGWALNQKVERGDKITKDMLTPVYLAEAATAVNLLQDFQIEATGYYARATIEEKTVLVETLVYIEEHLENDVREVEYAQIQLPSKVNVNDYVDVRIQFPNGEDYIVFSKKKVQDVAGVTLWLENDEAEILSMSSAMVDAYLEAGKLYAIRYVDPLMQEASEITYPVNGAVMDLIRKSPNIVDMAKLNLADQNRAALENNLRELDESAAEKVRQKEGEYNAVQTQQQKEQALIEANQSTQYSDTEIVNDDIGGE